MDPLQAKMFVRSLNSSGARILLAFILARTALDVQDLRDWTGMKRETIYDALNTLKVFGMVEKQIASHGRIVWLPAGDLLPGFQVSPKRTSELQESEIGTPALRGGDSINLTLNTESLNPQIQMSEMGTSGLPSVVEILKHTDKLFDGAVVNSKGLDDRDPLQVLAWCAYAYAHKSQLYGRPGGTVRNRLKDNQPAPESAEHEWRDMLPAAFLEALGLAEYTCDECQATFTKMAELSAHATTHPKSAEEIELDSHEEHQVMIIDASVRIPIHGSLNAEQAWQSVLSQLQFDMPRATFDSWVRDSKAVRYHGNVLTIGARNAYTRDWLESRLASTVSRLLVGILNASVAVEFVVGDTEPGEGEA